MAMCSQVFSPLTLHWWDTSGAVSRFELPSTRQTWTSCSEFNKGPQRWLRDGESWDCSAWRKGVQVLDGGVKGKSHALLGEAGNRTKATGHKLKYSKFLNVRKSLFYSRTPQLAQRGYRVFILADSQDLTIHGPSQPAPDDPVWATGEAGGTDLSAVT